MVDHLFETFFYDLPMRWTYQQFHLKSMLVLCHPWRVEKSIEDFSIDLSLQKKKFIGYW